MLRDPSVPVESYKAARQILEAIYREEPSYWPHGLDPHGFDGGLYLIREKRASRTGTTTAICEDCGKSSDWPASAMGTTELCPHCQHYMDIPDPDEDWGGVDFGKDEEETKK